ncbi:MAG: hypothetical protein KDI44_12040 [Thiothrix sp.]|nr:hypothetical protein [Thiothrix sp.]HPQ95034.1 hypothetical protein [Thiolinea sp.]
MLTHPAILLCGFSVFSALVIGLSQYRPLAAGASHWLRLQAVFCLSPEMVGAL